MPAPSCAHRHWFVLSDQQPELCPLVHAPTYVLCGWSPVVSYPSHCRRDHHYLRLVLCLHTDISLLTTKFKTRTSLLDCQQVLTWVHQIWHAPPHRDLRQSQARPSSSRPEQTRCAIPKLSSSNLASCSHFVHDPKHPLKGGPVPCVLLSLDGTSAQHSAPWFHMDLGSESCSHATSVVPLLQSASLSCTSPTP